MPSAAAILCYWRRRTGFDVLTFTANFTAQAARVSSIPPAIVQRRIARLKFLCQRSDSASNFRASALSPPITALLRTDGILRRCVLGRRALAFPGDPLTFGRG